MDTAFLYTERYFDYDYGGAHPLKIERLRLTHQYCKAFGLLSLPGCRQIETRAASEAEILRFHSPDYVQVLKRANEGGRFIRFSHGLGVGDNPAFQGLWDWSRLATGASLQCARLVSSGDARVAFNIAGGLHHALRSRASGFCYVNDPVVAIVDLLDRHEKVMYLDVDVHHGDGVQWAFYDDPRVLTVSFHQDGRTLFPGTGAPREYGKGAGEGYSVNVPVYPGADDEVFCKAFDAVVPRLLERFKPDVTVTQLGVDTLWDDPLGRLELTTNGFCHMVSFLNDNLKHWVALGGGGYDVFNVARCWTLAWAIMNGVEPPDAIPKELCKAAGLSGGMRCTLRDRPHTSRNRDQCLMALDETLHNLETEVFPRLG